MRVIEGKSAVPIAPIAMEATKKENPRSRGAAKNNNKNIIFYNPVRHCNYRPNWRSN